LAEENNDQGTFEMGGVRDVLPGGKPYGDGEARQALSQVWGRPVPDSAGFSLPQMLEAARKGQLKALFIVGENPLGSLPASSEIQQALENLEFLVCQELFLTETAKKAHVVLPACSYAEKDGTFTNTEGHLQSVRRAIDPIGESRPDWEVFSALSVLMNDSMEYFEVKEIGKEIHSLLRGTRTLGPTPLPSKPDPTAIARYVDSEYKRDLVPRYQVHGDGPSISNGLTLMISQSLFHSGKFSLKAKGLTQIESEGKLYLHPEEGFRRGIADGDRVKVMNGLGEMSTTVKFRERILRGMAMFPEHFDQEIRRLLPYTVDPETHVPYFKLAEIQIEKVEAG
jgi:predicted molibdopterin-dependent oxidoreductase YjgC